MNIDSLKAFIVENKEIKQIRSKDYNYNFHKKTGDFERWGNTLKEDPEFSPFGPELFDIEITTSCSGPNGDGRICNFCYKSNVPEGDSMSFELFEKIFTNISASRILTQIAFGVDATCTANPDTFKIMQHCKDNSVIPNVTVANVDDETAEKLANVCGAVAVSRYENKQLCYDSIKRLSKYGLEQVNIHILVSSSTVGMIMETFNDYKEGRIPGLNAIVLLSLKQKGRGTGYNPVNQEEFSKLVKFALDNDIPIGFDSCSYPKFLSSINYLKSENSKLYEQFVEDSEPCESGLFSFYCDTFGYAHACSFMEGEEWPQKEVNLAEVKDFVKDVWYSDQVIAWRKKLLENKRACPRYKV